MPCAVRQTHSAWFIDIGKLEQNQVVKLNTFQVHMLSTLDELYTFVQPDELTQEFGGSYDYNHAAWIQNRMVNSFCI